MGFDYGDYQRLKNIEDSLNRLNMYHEMGIGGCMTFFVGYICVPKLIKWLVNEKEISI